MVATTLSVSQTVYNPASPLFSFKGIKQLCYSPQQPIMTRVLLTGGSGFIAAHILDVLLQRGHSIVTTVRSQDKAKKIKEAYPNVPENRLSFAIVEDIAQEGAFEKAVISDPPFEAVIHTASPYHFDVTDVQKVS
jgi:nucleoside-diphosphate-sugar epimerase